jgi:two-component system, LytTR family, response regulator
MPIKVSVSEAIFLLDEEEIIYLQAYSNYTKLYLTGNRTIFSAKTLKAYEAVLPSSIFSRVHNGYLVNVNHICKIDLNKGIDVTQNYHIPISRRKKNCLKVALGT